MLNIYDDITYKWNMYMIFIICDIIELRLYVVFNGWYVMYDNRMDTGSNADQSIWTFCSPDYPVIISTVETCSNSIITSHDA